MAKISAGIDKLKKSLLNRNTFTRTVQIATYIILIFVGALMTVLNVITEGIGWGNGTDSILTYTTLAFTLLSLFCLAISFTGNLPAKIVSYVFAIGIIGMFTIFLISGQPDGFSAIWICLTPIATMVFMGRKKGTIFSLITFVILVLILWVKIYQYIPFIDRIQYKEYGRTFMIRFPILYISFFFVVFLLETIQDYQFDMLEKVNEINEKYSTHDQLTGIFNRKGFYDKLQNDMNTKTFKNIGFVILDIDFFKNLNDTYGHLAGDEILVELVKVMKDCLPDTVACRWGGEEFLMYYFDNGVDKKTLENFRETVQNYSFVYNNKVLRITISLGVFETTDQNINNRGEWLKKADDALYKAKETGRNKIVYY